MKPDNSSAQASLIVLAGAMVSATSKFVPARPETQMPAHCDLHIEVTSLNAITRRTPTAERTMTPAAARSSGVDLCSAIKERTTKEDCRQPLLKSRVVSG